MKTAVALELIKMTLNVLRSDVGKTFTDIFLQEIKKIVIHIVIKLYLVKETTFFFSPFS